MPSRRQAIICTNADPIHWQIYATQGVKWVENTNGEGVIWHFDWHIYICLYVHILGSCHYWLVTLTLDMVNQHCFVSMSSYIYIYIYIYSTVYPMLVKYKTITWRSYLNYADLFFLSSYLCEFVCYTFSSCHWNLIEGTSFLIISCDFIVFRLTGND